MSLDKRYWWTWLTIACVAVALAQLNLVWSQEPAVEAPPAVPEAEPAPPGEGATEPAEEEPLEVENEHAAFLVYAEVDRASRQYQEGQTLQLTVRAEVDAYIYVLYRQVDGTVYQIFPNSAQRDNRVAARQDVVIPARDDLFRWVVGPPFGPETIKVIASLEPIEELSKAMYASGRFNRVPAKSLQLMKDEVVEQPRNAWSAFDIQIETLPRDRTPGAAGTRRLGLFIGASKYRYHDVLQAATDGEGGMNLRGCHLDALGTAEHFKQFGKLDELKVLVDEQATRANIAAAVTEWLPSVSRPGDTVFISFSGHGGTVEDDDGDEADGLDEYLTPHDIVNTTVLGHLLDHPELVPADDVQRLQGLVDMIRRVGVEKAHDVLARHSGISDDTFGIWLQKLSGRQIVLLLDTCHSGGFAADEKSFEPPKRRGEFDFLDGELTRLKDIGQPEQAIISACKAWQTAYELPNGENGMMTTALLLSMRELQGPSPIEQNFAYIEEAMVELFRLWNEANREAGREPVEEHQPHMRNYCTRPLIFKP